MPFSQAQVEVLKAERIADPLARGYGAMNDAAFLASVTAADRPNPKTVMSAGEIFERIDAAEFVAMTAANKARVDRVLGLGAEIIVGPGNDHQAVSELIAAFGAGSATITTLSVYRDDQFSRANELGLPNPSIHDVARTN